MLCGPSDDKPADLKNYLAGQLEQRLTRYLMFHIS
jgi:hypothetical protein